MCFLVALLILLPVQVQTGSDDAGKDDAGSDDAGKDGADSDDDSKDDAGSDNGSEDDYGEPSVSTQIQKQFQSYLSAEDM